MAQKSNGNGHGNRRRSTRPADRFFQVTTLVDIPSELDDRLRQLAHQNQKSKTELIRELLVQGVANKQTGLETTSP